MGHLEIVGWIMGRTDLIVCGEVTVILESPATNGYDMSPSVAIIAIWQFTWKVRRWKGLWYIVKVVQLLG